MKSVNKNFIYNSVYQLLLYIIPLILTPYISRTLHAEKIGVYSYTYSFVYYFMLLTLLGINNYGARNIAKFSDEKEKMNTFFSELYGLQMRIGIVMLVVYNVLIFTVFNEYANISLIHNLFLISAILDINWLYFGLEKFKITITRNTIVKLFSLIFIFIFVKNESDLWIYTLIMGLSALLSPLYLFIILKKYVNPKYVPFKNSVKHLKSCLVLFIPVLAYGIYRVMDKTMIGSIANKVQLGLYDNAEKIINIPVSIITAMGTVMVPYMSKKTKNKEEIDKKILSSFELCFFLIMVMVFGLLAIASDFSRLYFGAGFEECGTIIKFLLPSILFAAIANVIRTNYLIPFEKDKIYVMSTIVGACVNLILNLLFIKKYGAIGACIGTVAAEFSVMIYQLIAVRKDLMVGKILKLLLKYFLKGLIMYIIIFSFRYFINNIYLRIACQMITAIIVYFILCRKYMVHDFIGRNEKNKKLL